MIFAHGVTKETLLRLFESESNADAAIDSVAHDVGSLGATRLKLTMTSSGSLVIRHEGHPELLVPYSTGGSLNDLLLRVATEFSLHGTVRGWTGRELAASLDASRQRSRH